ncbi:hypothetical protein ACH4S8_45000 [Streptomyces sp. NPDC021080]|uniref:hypothetical protein n=1 Tax=Streptomyces sp. NPDC021080 TaxID=3365110 RepID=UPI0037A68F02
MADDIVIRNRLAALLPEAEAREVKDRWDTGEQEVGLGLLVAGLLGHQAPISETVGVQLSVLAESWGDRERLTPQILECRVEGAPGPLKLIDGEGSPAPGATAGAQQHRRCPHCPRARRPGGHGQASPPALVGGDVPGHPRGRPGTCFKRS